MSGVWPAEGRLTGRSAASGRLVGGDGGNGERGKIGCWKRKDRSAGKREPCS